VYTSSGSVNGAVEVARRKDLTQEIARLRKGWKQGRPLPEALHKRALELYCSGVKPSEVARLVGASDQAVRNWAKAAGVSGQWAKSSQKSPSPEGTNAPAAPVTLPAPAQPTEASDDRQALKAPSAKVRDTAFGLSSIEQAAVLEMKKRHPSMGPAQLRTQLKRFKGWRLSPRAIAQLLKRHGYELVHVESRPKDQNLTRFEAPHRNALWQMDFTELRVGAERVSLLVVIDDFSRFCVAHEMMTEPSSEQVVEVLRRAIRQHGKPEAIYTDRGGAFLAWGSPSSVEHFLEDQLIEHHVGTSYHPQGRGKVESLIGTIQRELWNVVHFESIDEARSKVREFLTWYCHGRAHMGIDGLTPADRYFGRWEEVKARVDAQSRGRQLALADASAGRLTEEIAAAGGPVEVLRLLCANGRLELRFLGHGVDLGPVKA